MTAETRDLRAVTVAVVEIEPLPSRLLSKNGRDRVVTGVGAKSGRRFYKSDRHAEWTRVLNAAIIELRNEIGTRQREPYTRLTAHIAWYQRTLPDVDAVVARCAAIFDAAQHVGLIVNDSGLELGQVMRERVTDKRDERCVVRFVAVETIGETAA